MNNGNTVQSNKNSFFGIKVSNPGINVNNATDSQLQYQNNYSQEIFYTNGFANVLIGNRAPNTQNDLTNPQEGFFVAQQGVDVRQATDAQMIFNSNNDIFKIVLSGTATLSVMNGDTQGNATVAHNLGYAPVYLAYLGGTQIIQLPAFSFFAGVGISVIWAATVDANNIYFEVANFMGTFTATTWDIKYYLLQETATWYTRTIKGKHIAHRCVLFIWEIIWPLLLNQQPAI